MLRPWSSNLSGENTKPKSRVDCTKKCAPNLLCEFDFQMRWERLCKFGRLGYGVRLQIENTLLCENVTIVRDGSESDNEFEKR